jgi:hypothetical protein
MKVEPNLRKIKIIKIIVRMVLASCVFNTSYKYPHKFFWFSFFKVQLKPHV